jgi:hypothetical protein
LVTINNKYICAALRMILQFAFEYNTKMTNSSNGVNLYKIFEYLMIAEGPFSQAKRETWDYHSGSGRFDICRFCSHSMNIVISAFELVLFNKNV